MSPTSRGGWFDAKPRIAVQGGVVVAKPGKVTHPDAVMIVEAAQIEARPAILSRGRTYARAGQVIGVEVEPERAGASIQGSSHTPYQVELIRTTISGSDRVHASCTCPYTCDYDWCKHAAALAYVVAFLVDTQPATAALWAGEQPPADVPPLDADEFAALITPAPLRSFAERVADCEQIVTRG